MNQSITYLNTDQIDKEKALLLVQASIQAYNAYHKDDPTSFNSNNIDSPDGYEVIHHWTGVDAIFNEDKNVELYGVIFRSLNAPYTYIFSFRGTDSPEDLLDDFGYDPTVFVPHNHKVSVPADVRVESGFFHIYCDDYDDGSTYTPSMQKQLFTLIHQYQNSDKPIDKLYITGHSLGAAITALFTLDLALCLPHINASNYNYASPRVGNKAFVEFYEQQSAQKDETTRTIRIQNTRDKVPCVPLKDQRYQHLSYAYLLDFHKDAWFDFKFVVDNHDIHNYQAVLKCALDSETGLCINHHLSVKHHTGTYKVNSQKPEPSQVCSFW
ncbi:MAG: lipase family protein [Crocosphaera sp.]|nr:lipase family protein [Crocosphaera sp.]